MVALERELFGKASPDLCKVFGLAPPKPRDDVSIFRLRDYPQGSEIELPKRNGGVNLFGITEPPGFVRHGLLRGDEKYNRVLRQRPDDEVLTPINPRNKAIKDKKTIYLLQRKSLIERLVEKGIVLARVIDSNRPDQDGCAGYFTRLDSIKGKTPKDMEHLLGMKAGTYEKGVKVFTLAPSRLDPREFLTRGYSYLPGGKPTNFRNMTEEEIEEKLKTMKFPPGAGLFQIEVTKRNSVRRLKRHLGYEERL